MRVLLPVLLLSATAVSAQTPDARPRPRDAGVVIGVLPPGPLNAITDVAGVRVGHATVIRGDSVRTGVTAILPHAGNPFRERVPAALHVGNGFGKLLGVTQLRELGELETPILLTCTLCVWKAADALAAWMIARPGMENVRSINPVVGETNDGGMSDIRSRPIEAADVVRALDTAAGGPVAEGSVGAGTGTVAFGWKGGIGTSSRRLPASLGGYTVGVLVQTNFGGSLTVAGVPVGRALGRWYLKREMEAAGATASAGGPEDRADGSIIIVVATDAPLGQRALERLAARTMSGLARTGAAMTNGSGDYAIAFSTAESARRRPGASSPVAEVPADSLSPLFVAAAEATEEAIVSSLFRATDVRSAVGAAEPLPIRETLDVLRRAGALQPARPR